MEENPLERLAALFGADVQQREYGEPLALHLHGVRPDAQVQCGFPHPFLALDHAALLHVRRVVPLAVHDGIGGAARLAEGGRPAAILRERRSYAARRFTGPEADHAALATDACGVKAVAPQRLGAFDPEKVRESPVGEDDLPVLVEYDRHGGRRVEEPDDERKRRELLVLPLYFIVRGALGRRELGGPFNHSVSWCLSACVTAFSSAQGTGPLRRAATRPRATGPRPMTPSGPRLPGSACSHPRQRPPSR